MWRESADARKYHVNMDGYAWTKPWQYTTAFGRQKRQYPKQTYIGQEMFLLYNTHTHIYIDTHTLTHTHIYIVYDANENHLIWWFWSLLWQWGIGVVEVANACARAQPLVITIADSVRKHELTHRLFLLMFTWAIDLRRVGRTATITARQASCTIGVNQFCRPHGVNPSGTRTKDATYCSTHSCKKSLQQSQIKIDSG